MTVILLLHGEATHGVITSAVDMLISITASSKGLQQTASDTLNAMSERAFWSQAGSLEFLASQGFDFNKFIYEGVPLLRASDRDRHLTKIDAEDSPGRPEMSLAKAEDKELVDKLIARVTEWLQVQIPQLFLPS